MRGASRPGLGRAEYILDLQRRVGNQGVGRLLAGSANRTIARQPRREGNAIRDPHYPGMRLTDAAAEIPENWQQFIEDCGYDFKAFRIGPEGSQTLVLYDSENRRYMSIGGVEPPDAATNAARDAALSALQSDLSAYTAPGDSYHTGAFEVSGYVPTGQLDVRLDKYPRTIGSGTELELTKLVMQDKLALEKFPEGERARLQAHQIQVVQLMQGMARGAALEPVKLAGDSVQNGYHRILAASLSGLALIPVFRA
jgi:hypothetical protein